MGGDGDGCGDGGGGGGCGGSLFSNVILFKIKLFQPEI